MKRITRGFVLLVMIFTITGCGNHESGHNSGNSGNSVDQVINEQMNSAEMDYFDSRESGGTDDLPELSEETIEETIEETGTRAADGVDYDLTAMSSDMVYAMVYQMMTDPDTYVGKTFRMEGLYYSVYYEPTARYYHYCIIQDALACCAQGMEFICDDGTCGFPEDDPEEHAEIVVQGVFETYQEEGDDRLYCRLKGAELNLM